MKAEWLSYVAVSEAARPKLPWRLWLLFHSGAETPDSALRRRVGELLTAAAVSADAESREAVGRCSFPVLNPSSVRVGSARRLQRGVVLNGGNGWGPRLHGSLPLLVRLMLATPGAVGHRLVNASGADHEPMREECACHP
jgi:hypothetical protein